MTDYSDYPAIDDLNAADADKLATAGGLDVKVVGEFQDDHLPCVATVINGVKVAFHWLGTPQVGAFHYPTDPTAQRVIRALIRKGLNDRQTEIDQVTEDLRSYTTGWAAAIAEDGDHSARKVFKSLVEKCEKYGLNSTEFYPDGVPIRPIFHFSTIEPFTYEHAQKFAGQQASVHTTDMGLSNIYRGVIEPISHGRTKVGDDEILNECVRWVCLKRVDTPPPPLRAEFLGDRRIKLTGIPDPTGRGTLSELVISIDYVDDDDNNRCIRGITLDNCVIPVIVKLINRD